MKSSMPGTGIINMVQTVDDYQKILDDLYEQVNRTPFEMGNECIESLICARNLISACIQDKIPFDFSVEETVKSCIFSTQDWLASKASPTVDVISTLYQWKLEKFQDRAWDLVMTADVCEGIMIRIMERVHNDEQNVAVVQIFLSIQELESCDNSPLRIKTRLIDGLSKLKKLVEDNIPLVGVAKAN